MTPFSHQVEVSHQPAQLRSIHPAEGGCRGNLPSTGEVRVESRLNLADHGPWRSNGRQRPDRRYRPPKKLVLTWRHEILPEIQAEGHSRLTYELESKGEAVKLTLIHEIDKPESKLIQAVSNGWPAILSSLKSLLEIGEPLDETQRWPKGM